MFVIFKQFVSCNRIFHPMQQKIRWNEDYNLVNFLLLLKKILLDYSAVESFSAALRTFGSVVEAHGPICF